MEALGTISARSDSTLNSSKNQSQRCPKDKAVATLEAEVENPEQAEEWGLATLEDGHRLQAIHPEEGDLTTRRPSEEVGSSTRICSDDHL